MGKVGDSFHAGLAFGAGRRGVDRCLRFFALLTAAVVFCVTTAGIAASSPECHEVFHPDENESEHVCLATILAAGGVETVDARPVLVSILRSALLDSLGKPLDLPRLPYPPTLGRAPPPSSCSNLRGLAVGAA